MITEEEIRKLSSPEAPKIVTKGIPGQKAREFLEKAQRFESPTRAGVTLPLVWDVGCGATVKDVDGNIFIDMSSGVGVSSVGRNHPKVVEVIKTQSEKVMHCGGPINPKSVQLAERLSDVMPQGLRNHWFSTFTLSGSGAVETAIKYARAITGRSQIIAFEGAYHGVFYGSLALTIGEHYRASFGPLMPDVIHLPYAYCYRCFNGLNQSSCKLECAKYFEYMISSPRTPAKNVAAVIVEPMQGEGGYIEPAPEFLAKIKEVCDKNGILFIVDEVQSGAGRTGKMWAIEHYGITPDILVWGKGVGGDQPIAGITVNAKYRDKLPAGTHPITFAGNGLACAVALVNIDIITNVDMNLMGRATILGEKVKNQFIEAAKDTEMIGEVRGKGLMIGIELVKNRENKEPISESKIKIMLQEIRERGVVVFSCGRSRNVLRLMPSLVISEEHLNRAIDIILDTLKRNKN